MGVDMVSSWNVVARMRCWREGAALGGTMTAIITLLKGTSVVNLIFSHRTLNNVQHMREAPCITDAFSTGILPNSFSTPPPPPTSKRTLWGIYFSSKIQKNLKQQF